MRISKLARKMIAVVGAASLVFIVAGTAFYRSAEALPFAYGVLLLSALNIGKIILLEYSVDKTLGMEKMPAQNFLRLFYFLRLVLTGGVLVFAALTPYVSLWGAVAGVLTLQIAAFSMKFLHREDAPLPSDGESSAT